jgi:hypothetical protein
MDINGLTWPGYLPRLLWIRRVCPRCSSFEFKEAESQPLDGLLSFFALRPVRCVNCWRRYYWFAQRKADKT